jgi:predicted extracellular nuclease
VASYNVENFWDDVAENSGSATYDEFRKGGSNWYSDQMYQVKAQHVADAIRMAGSPDVVAMEEFESANNSSRSLELLKPYVEAMGYKYFALGQQNPDNPVAVTTAVISKFPISKNERLDFTTSESDFAGVGLNGETLSSLNTSARDPQVVTIDVAGTPLRVYASHWKSRRGGPGAGDAMRMAIAKLIKNDIDKQKIQNPSLDILVTGDLNSSYEEASHVDGLLATDDKNRLKSDPSDTSLYNFWFELPAAERCSYMHQGQLNCLDHVLSTASLFDGRGIDLVEGSFQVIGHNGGEAAEKLLLNDGRTPRRWSMSKGNNSVRFNGNGYSDHLPLVATFKITNRCTAGQ